MTEIEAVSLLLANGNVRHPHDGSKTFEAARVVRGIFTRLSDDGSRNAALNWYLNQPETISFNHLDSAVAYAADIAAQLKELS